MNKQFYPNNQLRKKIQNYSYKLQDIIGKGHNSVIFRGINQKNQQIVAIKAINIKNIHGKAQRKLLQGQIDALKKFNHSNIIKCYDVFSTVNNCYIISQFCNEGDLQILLKKRKLLPEQQVIPIIRNIIEGFKCMAQTQILHRNLKPTNLLIKDKVTKISGFSFAKKLNSNTNEPVNDGIMYKSPQILESNIFSLKSQIWSIGIILYQMLHGKVPWISQTEQKLKVQITKTSISLMSNFSEQLKDFIRKCLVVDVNKRIGFKQFLNHPFVLKICNKGISDFLINNKNIQKNVPLNNQIEKHNSPNHNQIHHSYSAQKQLQCQMNWMRFLHKLNQIFPKINQSGKSTLNLRFIICKQLLSQLDNLKKSFSGENVFRIHGWRHFTSQKQQSNKYLKVLQDYSKKYEKNKKDFQQSLQVVKKDRKMNKIADDNFNRSQSLYIQAIQAALQQSRGMWKKLKQNISNFQVEELPTPWKQQLLRLDYIITYYQLNCILIDNFNNPDHFTKNSKLQEILEYKPMFLGLSNIKDIENKLILLQITK